MACTEQSSFSLHRASWVCPAWIVANRNKAACWAYKWRNRNGWEAGPASMSNSTKQLGECGGKQRHAALISGSANATEKVLCCGSEMKWRKDCSTKGFERSFCLYFFFFSLPLNCDDSNSINHQARNNSRNNSILLYVSTFASSSPWRDASI